MDKGVEKRGQYNHKKIEPFLPVRKERAYDGWLVYQVYWEMLCVLTYTVFCFLMFYILNQHTSVGHNYCKYWQKRGLLLPRHCTNKVFQGKKMKVWFPIISLSLISAYKRIWCEKQYKRPSVLYFRHKVTKIQGSKILAKITDSIYSSFSQCV